MVRIDQVVGQGPLWVPVSEARSGCASLAPPGLQIDVRVWVLQPGPVVQAALERLRSALPMHRAAIVITERWRGLLPSVQQGFSAGFLEALEKSGAGDYICELAYRQSGIFTVQDLAEIPNLSRWRRWEPSPNSKRFSAKRTSAI